MAVFLRVVSLAVVNALSSVPYPSHASVQALLGPENTIGSLHRDGEERFEAGDYGGAREAWMGAYAQMESDDETWPYRTTLLSLIVTTSLAEFSVRGDRDVLRRVADLLDDALEQPLEEAYLELLKVERERLDPYLDPPPPPAEATPPPVEPSAPTSPVDPRPKRVIPNALWVGAGATLFAGGIASVVVGSRFRPRAIGMVNDAGLSSHDAPGSNFVDEERSKGTAWMVAGGVAAGIGAAALVVGIVRLTRER